MLKIWKDELSELPWSRWLAIASLRGLVTSTRNYGRNQGGLRAAGLTYVSLMALVPVLTVIFALAGAFGIKEALAHDIKNLVSKWNKDPREFMLQVLDHVDKINLTTVGSLGLLLLVYVVLSLMGRIEQAFNLTWRAERGRNLARRYADYVAILFLVPLLVLLATGLNATFQLEAVLASLDESWPWLAGMVKSGLRFLPFLFLWMAATLLYKVMPNAAVRWGPAVLTGLISGGIWVMAQWLFLRFQIGITRASAIYGSLALIPLFLVYVNVSWTVVLWGAELNHAMQNLAFLTRPGKETEWSPVRRRRLGVALMRAAANEFQAGRSLSLAAFAARAGLTQKQVAELSRVLIRSGLLHSIKKRERVVPALPPGEIPLSRVLLALDGVNGMDSEGVLEEGDEAVLTRLRSRITEVEGSI
ncbi:MAG: YihY/virulence factor BrkB family protein [Planctomycetota bacterium]